MPQAVLRSTAAAAAAMLAAIIAIIAIIAASGGSDPLTMPKSLSGARSNTTRMKDSPSGWKAER